MPLADLERLSIDLDHLRRKRDRLTGALRAIGYNVHVPDGTFSLFPQSPLPDDRAFAELLGRHDVFVMPGAFCGTPGYFRISLTASEEMIERSLPIFAAAWHEARLERMGYVERMAGVADAMTMAAGRDSEFRLSGRSPSSHAMREL